MLLIFTLMILGSMGYLVSFWVGTELRALREGDLEAWFMSLLLGIVFLCHCAVLGTLWGIYSTKGFTYFITL